MATDKNKLLKKLPKKVRVGHRNYDIKTIDKFNDDMKLGELDYMRGCLSFSTETNRDIQDSADSVLHELLHAIWYENNIWKTLEINKDTEEKIITILSSGLIQVFMNNPALAKLIVEGARVKR